MAGGRLHLGNENLENLLRKMYLSIRLFSYRYCTCRILFIVSSDDLMTANMDPPAQLLVSAY